MDKIEQIFIAYCRFQNWGTDLVPNTSGKDKKSTLFNYNI